MNVQHNGIVFNVEVGSILLNVAAFACFIASFWDGIGTATVGIGLLILDALRYPYPNIMDITDEVEEVDDDDGDGPVMS